MKKATFVENDFATRKLARLRMKLGIGNSAETTMAEGEENALFEKLESIRLASERNRHLEEDVESISSICVKEP